MTGRDPTPDAGSTLRDSVSALLSLLAIPRRGLARMALLSLLMGGSTAFLLYLIAHSVTGAALPGAGTIAAFAATLAVYVLAQRTVAHDQVAHTEKTSMRLRLEFTRRFMLARYETVERLDSAAVVTLITQDVVAVSQAWPMFVSFSVAAVLLATVLVYLCVLAPLGFLVTAGGLATGAGIYTWISRSRKISFHAVRLRYEHLIALLLDCVKGVKELKIDRPRRESLYRRELDEAAAAHSSEYIRAHLDLHRASLLGNVVIFLTVGALAMLLPHMVEIAPEVRTTFVVLLAYCIGPVMQIFGAIPGMASAAVSAQRLQDAMRVLDRAAEPGLVDGPPLAEAYPGWRSITLENIEYSYAPASGEEGYHLGPVSLSIARGEIVFITGGNGSGKSTLGKVLTGVYRSTRGAIAVDGAAVDEQGLDRYRQLFAGVFADFHLFHKALDPAGEQRAAAFARLLTDFRLDARVASRARLNAQEFSQGQKKRLALAVALVQERPVLFFDEWAAEQDPDFRAHFYETLLPALKAQGRTVVAITHDERYFRCADRIVKLDFGKIDAVVKGRAGAAHAETAA